jgi:NAD(P)-dependent dehydrogenase (short-subunit alcohol dehydrogenase family)
MEKLSNKVALITGGNSGIGLATAKLFKAQGARVIITASSQKTFEKAKLEHGSVFDVVQADVSKNDELDRLYSHIQATYGKFDVLFANAGVSGWRMTAEVTEEYYDQQFNINTRGLFFTVQKALPLMNKGSTVVLTASSASVKGMPGAVVYSATKAAVRSMARTWTAEVPVGDVRFNVISPGPIETPMFENMGFSEEQLAGLMNMIPAKRVGKAEEMAKTVLFLSSEDSSYIAGHEIFADGGIVSV